MRVRAVWAAPFVALLASSTAWAQDAPMDPTRLISVLDIQVAEGVDAALALPFTNRVIDALTSLPGYRVIDRSNRDAILAEQGFAMSDCVAGECRVEVGRMLGVGTLVTGTVSLLGSSYYLTLQMIDVETGEVRESVNDRCQCMAEDIPELALPLTERLFGVREEEPDIELTYAEDAPAPGLAPPAPVATPPTAEEDSGSVFTTWWFWTGVGVLAAGAGVTTFMLLNTGDETPGARFDVQRAP